MIFFSLSNYTLIIILAATLFIFPNHIIQRCSSIEDRPLNPTDSDVINEICSKSSGGVASEMQFCHDFFAQKAGAPPTTNTLQALTDVTLTETFQNATFSQSKIYAVSKTIPDPKTAGLVSTCGAYYTEMLNSWLDAYNSFNGGDYNAARFKEGKGLGFILECKRRIEVLKMPVIDKLNQDVNRLATISLVAVDLLSMQPPIRV